MKANIGIPDKSRDAVGEILNDLLADLHVLNVRTRNYHWNVTGPLFHELHALFEKLYDEQAGQIDEVAERARAIDVVADATLAGFVKRARLKEQPGEVPAAPSMITHLVADYEALIRAVRPQVDACQAAHGDVGTADFLTGLIEAFEKAAWMLRASAEK